MPTSNLHVKAKILCTMGPAVASVQKINAMIKAGANAFRLNMSHGSYSMHKEFIGYIRTAEEKLKRHIPIVLDLQGPKIRVGDLGGRPFITLLAGHEVMLEDATIMKNKKHVASDNLIPVQYPTLAKDVKPGDELLLDDGLLKLKVLSTKGDTVRCMVVYGGDLKPRKGINLPQTSVSQPSMTSKDRADIRFGIDHDVDYIALSFVRTASDIEAVRKYITKYGGTQQVVAKIEKPEAVQNIESIVRASDVIMVARGDLGVEIPAESVPMVQKHIISICNAYAVPVITATQMLESMIQNPRPTRAEASDVANAVLDGTDAVMLSAETSVGAYPVEAVHYMRLICSKAEQALSHSRRPYAAEGGATTLSNTQSIAEAAAQISEESRVAAIVSLSYSGETARLISSRRPKAPVIAITTLRSVARRMNLVWGVSSLILETVSTTDDTIESIKQHLLQEKYVANGSTVVFTIGRPLVGRARTNMLSLETIQSHHPKVG